MSDHFNEKSKAWDADEMVKKLSSAIGASILENTRLNPQMNVMDFGTGTGLISSQVAPLVSKIVAVDISDISCGCHQDLMMFLIRGYYSKLRPLN